MQRNKQRQSQAVEDPFTVIQCTFATLHPLLKVASDPTRRQQTRDALQRLEKGVKAYKKKTVQRSGPADADDRIAWLDSAGVELWNASMYLMRGIGSDDADDLGTVASARLVALNLLELGAIDKSSPANLYRLLEVFSKTVMSLMRANRYEDAKETLLEAADYQGMVERLPLVHVDKSVAGKTLLHFYLARIKVCVAEDNHELAEEFAQKALGLDQTYGLGVDEYRLLANDCWETGTHLRLVQETEPSERIVSKLTAAMRWLDVGRQVLSAAVDKFGLKPGFDGLQRALLRGLARCYLSPRLQMPDAIEKASELLSSLSHLVDPNDTVALHDLDLLRLAVLRRQDAAEDVIKDALDKIIHSAVWHREGLAELICEITQNAKTLEVRNGCFQNLMQEALRNRAATPLVMTIFLALTMQARQIFDVDPRAALNLMRKCLEDFPEPVELSEADSNTATGIQSILWALGEKALGQEVGSHLAAECFELAAHPTLIACGGRDASKCLRKGAMCLVEGNDMEAASRLVEKCAMNEASTHYIRLLIAIRQGSEEAALQEIDVMLGCPDVDGRQIILASGLAAEGPSRELHVKCLEALVMRLQKSELGELGVDGLLLVRSMVKTTLEQISSASDVSLVQSLNEYLSAAHGMVEAGPVKSEESLKSLSWLCKTAYNATSRHAQEWDRDQVANLFDTTSILITDYQSLKGDDPEMSGLLASSSFACMCGHLLRYREMSEGDEKTVLRNELLAYLPKCRSQVDAVTTVEKGQLSTMAYMLQTVEMADIELLCEAADWSALELSLQKLCGEAGSGERETLESISDLLSQYPGCPQRLTYGVLEALLQAMMPARADDVGVFAKWIKASLHVLLSRNEPSDDKAAAGLVMRVMDLLKTPLGAEHYPPVQKEWLFATMWNRGLELYNAGRLPVALWWANRAMLVGGGLDLPDRQMKEYQEHVDALQRAQVSERSRAPLTQNTPRVSQRA